MNALKKSLLAAGLAATTLAAASPAMAQPYSYHRGGDHTGAIVGAGILGLAVGAIVASSANHHDRYYDNADYYYDEPLPSGWYVRDGFYWDDYGHRYSRDEFRHRFPGSPDRGPGGFDRGPDRGPGFADHGRGGPGGPGGPGGDMRRGFDRDRGDMRRGF